MRNPRNNIWRDADGEICADEDGPSTADIIAAVKTAKAASAPDELENPLSHWIGEPRRQAAGAS